jgi:glycosyltransferase involved in cell wall biosynthesis
MVKNGGSQFYDMLLKNMPLIDRWTILDTGSTDNTISIIDELLINKKKGNLYQEPFINFRDSRNRLLDLAGKDCKYILMLDDTYTINGDLRAFLNEVRDDQLADSFTMYIKSDDVEYGSKTQFFGDIKIPANATSSRNAIPANREECWGVSYSSAK